MSDIVLGLAELLDSIDKLNKLPEEWGKEALKRVQDYSPVATGLLKDSWQLIVADGQLTLQNNAQDKEGTYYAIYQEFGTTRDRPQLFLSRTINEAEDILHKAKQKVGL